MSTAHRVSDSRTTPSRGAPTWWLLFTRELQELWLGGKAPVLLLIFSVLLGIMTWVMASNSELSLIPPQEMVYETMKAAIAVGLFISLIIGADSISGERERATLEGLLLTPTSRRQIVLGKFLAGVTPWPVAMLIAIPYMWVLSQGNEVFPVRRSLGCIAWDGSGPRFYGHGNARQLLVQLEQDELVYRPRSVRAVPVAKPIARDVPRPAWRARCSSKPTPSPRPITFCRRSW